MCLNFKLSSEPHFDNLGEGENGPDFVSRHQVTYHESMNFGRIYKFETGVLWGDRGELRHRRMHVMIKSIARNVRRSRSEKRHSSPGSQRMVCQVERRNSFEIPM